MFNGQNNNYYQSPYKYNNYQNQNFIGNNNVNQMRYNKGFSSDPIEITPLQEKYKTPDYNKINSNNLKKDFQSYGKLHNQYDNANTNNNNLDYMNWNNLKKIQMDVNNNNMDFMNWNNLNKNQMNLNNNNMDFRNGNNINKNRMKINNNNMDFMNRNNINKNRMNEINNRVQNDFYFKQFEGTKKQIPAQKKIEMSNYDRELLKLFIYIYYYEKIVLEKNIFYNSEKDFYLINPGWINKFKELFSRDKLEKKLESFNKQYNYNNLVSNIDSIIDNVYEEDIIMKDKNFPEINLIMTSISKIQNISYTNPGIIIPSKIVNIIKNLDKEIKKFFQPKNFFFQSNLVYYINSPKKIIVGYLKDNIKFISKYIFEFENNLEQSEIYNIIFTPINNYINQIKCNPKLFFQQIFVENKPIGKLLILDQGKKYRSESSGGIRVMNNPIKNEEKEIINKYNI